MTVNLIIAFIVGWCGTGWPIRLPGGSGGGGIDPDWPWPPNCPVCGPLIGGISAIIIVFFLEPQSAGGWPLLMAFAFFGGSFGASLAGSLRRMMSR
jgi:hypothetical protein